MEKRLIRVLGVCGSGAVSSNLLAARVKEILEERGYTVDAVGVVPQKVQEYVARGWVDLIVTTSLIPENLRVPVIKGVPLLTGIREAETINEILQAVEQIVNKPNA